MLWRRVALQVAQVVRKLLTTDGGGDYQQENEDEVLQRTI